MTMRRHAACWTAGLVVFFASGVAWGQSMDAQRLKGMLEGIRTEHRLPALGAAVVTVDGLTVLATTGVRKRGEGITVSDVDLWHLGSNGKAMTATLMARLVERGKLRWDQTLRETFSDLVPTMPERVQGVTLMQLLSHQAGLKPNFELRRYVDRSDLPAARLDAVREALSSGFTDKPGGKASYSNWGYVIASAMAERVTSQRYEDLMRQEVFEPLGMTSAGFGGTGTVGQIDQPWPHFANGSPAPSNGAAMDNVATMAAAGTMHMSLADHARFVKEHLLGAQGKSRYLKPETFAVLHTPSQDDVALGWKSVDRAWAGGRALTHAGSNTMNFALVWLAPRKGFAVMVVTNQGDSFKVTDQAAGMLIKAMTSQ